VSSRFRIDAGDARAPETYAALLGGEKAQLLLTDPPYCLLTRRRKGGDPRESKGRKLDHEIVIRFDDVRAIVLPALRHRVVLSYRAEAEGVSDADVIAAVSKAAR